MIKWQASAARGCCYIAARGDNGEPKAQALSSQCVCWRRQDPAKRHRQRCLRALYATPSTPSRGAKCARPASAAPIVVRKGHSPTAVSTTIAAIERASSHLGSHGFERAATAAATECKSRLNHSRTHFSSVQSPLHSTTRIGSEATSRWTASASVAPGRC